MKFVTLLSLTAAMIVSTGHCQEFDRSPATNSLSNSGDSRRARPAQPLTLSRPQTRFESPVLVTPVAPPYQTQVPVGPDDIGRQQRLAEVTAELRNATADEEKKDAKAKIKSVLEEQYDAFLDQHQAQLDRMAQKLEQLEQQLKRRRDAKSRLVDLRLELLVSQAEGIGWPNTLAPWGAAGTVNWNPDTQLNRPTPAGVYRSNRNNRRTSDRSER